MIIGAMVYHSNLSRNRMPWRMQEKSGMLKISTRDHFEFSMTSSFELLQSSWKKVMGNVDKI